MSRSSLRVLLVGNGGREHALAWKLAQSPSVSAIFAVPGNGGTAAEPKTKNVSSVKADDFAGLLKFAVGNEIDLLIPGPEAPLVDGIVDYFKQHGPARIACFGPSKAAARMEGSKAFSKDFMRQFAIPTAAYGAFTSFDEAKAYVDANRDLDIVIKADGLAAGKGVIIPSSYEEAIGALETTMLKREFGDAGNAVVIEEFLDGEEISVLSFCDGHSILSLPAAQDHKRVNDNDVGKNTGGMGCYAPTQIAGPDLMDQIHRQILQPTVDNMRRQGYPMVGCLFTGFMLTSKGPKVLEYNVRFGDPETQTLLPLMENDLADVIMHCTAHTLDAVSLKVKPASSTTVVVASGGYPDAYAKNVPMTLSTPAPDTVLFHAGTSLDPSDQTVKTSGGRVIASTATGPSIHEAVEKAYAGVKQCISFDKMHFRNDIARRELQRKPHTAPTAAPMTYAGAGVSVDAGNALVQRIKPLVASTARPGADAQIGGFGGTFSLSAAGYGADAPNLICAIDGIGTKLMLAQVVNDYSTVGIDLVAMNVNDLVVQGAEPVAFLDYYACGKLDVDAAASFVSGVVAGCKASGSALVGGETAEMAGLYAANDFDAGGCAIGVIARHATVLPDTPAMRPGDALLGLASSGAHSNGFSLIRKLVAAAGLAYAAPAPWAPDRPLGRALLTPTRIYVRSLLAALRAHPSAVRGMAHVTGGGLTDNVPRMLPAGLAAHIDVGAWSLPPVFRWCKSVGAIADAELARTFNCGVGMVLVVDAARADAVAACLRGEGETVYAIGRLKAAAPGAEQCVLTGMESWS